VISNTILIMETLNLPYEIIVVDDGSTDTTGLIASKYKVRVISNEKNYGKGYSLRRAIQNSNGEIIVTIDSDGEHEPKEIPDLIVPLFNGTDIVTGSRFMGNNHSQSTTTLHQIGNFLFNFTILTLTGKRVTDSQTGFRAIKRAVLEKLDLESNGYEIETEMIVKGLKNGCVIKEKPISCERRKYSMSKIRVLSDGQKILKTILKSSFS
jgi:glycosyltransferase involved in cell wall biosynthesis